MYFRAALVATAIATATVGWALPANWSPGCLEWVDYTAQAGDCV